MIRLFKGLYLKNRFFLVFGGVIAVFLLSFAIPLMFPLAQTILAVALAVSIIDVFLLFSQPEALVAYRRTPRLLSLSDPNPIYLQVDNNTGLELALSLVDELPEQLQNRSFKVDLSIPPYTKQQIDYDILPLERGEYHFGHVNLFASSLLGLVVRRFKSAEPEMVRVYPSVIQMKKFELMAFARISHFEGIKKVRKVGHGYEFEQIKEYVKGDDYRSVNWKATGRSGRLMVNQYEDERSQQVYSIIDKSRSMKMPFKGLSLMDYAINTSLVISNIALQKHDKAGLMSFSDKLGSSVKADSSSSQLQRILEALYNEQEREHEANYELLYRAVRHLIKGRSLLLLYTNFESHYAMQRVLPILRKLNRMHLLVVLFFQNTEIMDFAAQPSKDVSQIYDQTIARKFVQEKERIVQELTQYGIQCILTRPEDLNINTVNKYLELKSRSLI